MAMTQTSLTISSGPITGLREDGVDRYLGIPFAAPPSAENRFALPAAPTPWNGPRECFDFGATAPQTPYPGHMGQILGSVEIAGQDILTCNVWAPANAKELPVVLWLHGGAFERGTAAIDVYDGTTFARDGVIFVSINYRLGIEGFAVLEGVPRNLGLEDAAAGLRWVLNEIVHFGGDPQKITIMGESAGASLAAGLLTRAEASLVAGAILQSGPMGAQTPQKAGRVTRKLAKRLGIGATLEAFKSASAQDFLRARSAQMKGKTLIDAEPSFVFCLDQKSLPEVPYEGVRKAQIPVLIGNNTEEYRLWFTAETLAKVDRFKLWLVCKALKISNQAIAEVKKDWPAANNGEVLGQLISDKIFRSQAVKLAAERTSPTYLYEFAWRTPTKNLGATHALELGFTFDALGTEGARRMAQNPPQALADQMHRDWVAFIKTGVVPWQPYAKTKKLRIYDERVTEETLPRARVLKAMGV